jgi:4-amino-4-deoxy-L-arabinose transferase-like glycosyltransferase
MPNEIPDKLIKSSSGTDASARTSFKSAIRHPRSAILVLFSLLLASTWQRWTQPLMDHGREMNLPARILAGERLYADVQFLYGPFAPQFNALLYRIFGIHLSVLKVSGAICAVIILFMVYQLARNLMGEWESFLAAGLVMVLCALKSTANYIQPYAYAALYGLVFALGSLLCAIGYLRREAPPLEIDRAPGNPPGVRTQGTSRIFFAGLLAGLSVISKPEIALAALAAGSTAVLLESAKRRKLLWRDAAAFLTPVAVITTVTYGVILSAVPLRTLLEENHVLFTNMPPQLVYFNRHVSGLAQWPSSLWFSLAGVGVFALWAGLCAVAGAVFSRRRGDWRVGLKIGLVVAIGGALWREAAIRFFHTPSDVTPFSSAAFVLPAIAGLVAWNIFWGEGRGERSPRASAAAQILGGAQAFPPETAESSRRARVLLLILVFSFVSILRAILNVTATGPYTPFFIPTLVVVYLYLLFRVAPAIFATSDSTRAAIRRAAMIFIAVLIAGMAVNSAKRLRRLDTFAIRGPRGSFITVPDIGGPLSEAIDYARRRTRPDEYVLSLPAATTVNFLAERRYPLREEIVHPGFVAGENESDAIERIKARNTPLILIANTPMSEFRDRAFGVDYNQRLMGWIQENYHLAARFDSKNPDSRGAKLGDEPFFILAYERNP